MNWTQSPLIEDVERRNDGLFVTLRIQRWRAVILVTAMVGAFVLGYWIG